MDFSVFETLESFEQFIFNNEIPSELVPSAVDRLMELTLTPEVDSETPDEEDKALQELVDSCLEKDTNFEDVLKFVDQGDELLEMGTSEESQLTTKTSLEEKGINNEVSDAENVHYADTNEAVSERDQQLPTQDGRDKFLDRSDFAYCEMDTDSAYIAISGEKVEDLVRPELKDVFEQEKHQWFPRTDTPENKAYDKRTPGLFKEEWSGDGIIGLCSKTYYCFGTSDKFSCKGINKRCNDIDKDKFLQVLRTRQSATGLNKGFRVVNHSMYTYNQTRAGFSYFYPKRKVLDDGVTTIPLDI
ncbi:hypothetical protein AC249_AIPGENE21562 [Exaiptasia diaphana]|nr:hypothetical protein AC249_AIPGENE21562 [Exaiptasia diaphana]